MARPSFQPTDKDRALVEQLAGLGTPQESIALLIQDQNGKYISARTLRKHFSRELSIGEVRANAKIGQTLFKKAISGDTACMIFWLKTRARWKETPQGVELTGKDGAPLEQRTTVVDEQKIKAAVRKLEAEY